LCSGLTLRTRGKIVSLRARALITGGKCGREVTGPTFIVVYCRFEIQFCACPETRELTPGSGTYEQSRLSSLPVRTEGPRSGYPGCRCGQAAEIAQHLALDCTELVEARRQLQRQLQRRAVRSSADFVEATADPCTAPTIVQWLLATSRFPEF
jgi:hypothetical protein